MLRHHRRVVTFCYNKTFLIYWFPYRFINCYTNIFLYCSNYYWTVILAVHFLTSRESNWRCFRSCAISISHGRTGAECIFFLKKSWRPSLVVTLKTQAFIVTTNAQNTLKRGQVPSERHIFSKGRLCSSEGGGLCYGTMAQWPVQACFGLLVHSSILHCQCVIMYSITYINKSANMLNLNINPKYC